MQLYSVILQGYDREAGLSFTVTLHISSQNGSEARAFALEEAVRQHLPVAVVAKVINLGTAPQGQEAEIIAVSPRTYVDDIP